MARRARGPCRPATSLPFAWAVQSPAASVHAELTFGIDAFEQTRQELYPEHAHWIVAEPGWELAADRVAVWLESKLAWGVPPRIEAAASST